MKTPQIIPSLLSADFSCLKNEIMKVEKAGAGILHLDVMDGHFVPNISFGSCVVKSVRKITRMTLDVHLMISDPLKYVGEFAAAGADMITFHLESQGVQGKKNVLRLIRKIRMFGKKPGISIKPATPAGKIFPLMNQVDLVLVMTVEPGSGGQEMIKGALDKVKLLKKYIQGNGLNCLLSVDGGINLKNAAEAANSGADLLVCGNSVFSMGDPGAAFKKLSYSLTRKHK